MIAAFPLLVLLAIGTACSVIGCELPFAGLAAAAALNLSRRDSILALLSVWLLNQVFGFTLHAYPHALNTYMWGVALGIATLVAFAAARALRGNLFAAFGGAFVAFELVLVVSSVWLGGWEAYALHYLVEILAINAAWFAGAHVTLRLVARRPIFGAAATD
jgi:hypothetical protein